MPTAARSVTLARNLLHLSSRPSVQSLKPRPLRLIPSYTPRRTLIMQKDIVNFYAGAPPLNRLSFQRSMPEKLNGYLPNAKFMLFVKGNPLVHAGEIGRLLFLSYAQVEPILGGQYGTHPAEVTDSRQQKAYESIRYPHTLPTLVFIGFDERDCPKGEDLNNPTGTPYFALDASALGFDAASVQGDFAESRAAGSLMSPWEAGVFATARPLIDWNFRHQFCQACGSKTYSLWAGWKRSCVTAVDGSGKTCWSTTGLHNFCYPRTDPVIIMGILDSTGDKMLLGRQKAWPKGMYSCLAGFIEPGESFEEAVRREVLEEAGIEVGPVSYSSCQPWPYPANLMVGCFGRAKENQKIRLDLDKELEHCDWFPREVVARIAASKDGSTFTRGDYNQLNIATKGKDVPEGEADQYASFTRLPPDTAIAGKLMRQWALGAHAVHLVSNL